MKHIEKILKSPTRLSYKYLIEACLISLIGVAGNTFVFIKDLKHFPIPDVWVVNLAAACKGETFAGELWYKTYSESMRA
jgi:hypothetical protein